MMHVTDQGMHKQQGIIIIIMINLGRARKEKQCIMIKVSMQRLHGYRYLMRYAG